MLQQTINNYEAKIYTKSNQLEIFLMYYKTQPTNCNMLIIFLLLLIVLINKTVTTGVNPWAHLFAMEVLLKEIIIYII